MSNFIYTAILEDEVKCLSKYFTSRNMSHGEVVIILQTALDKEHFVTAMKGMKKLNKS